MRKIFPLMIFILVFYIFSCDDEIAVNKWYETFPDLDPDVCGTNTDLDLAGFSPDYELIKSSSLLGDFNFYFITLLQNVSEINSFLASDSDITSLSQTRYNQLMEADSSCNDDLNCYIDKITWTNQDIEDITELLSDVLTSSSAPIDIVEQHIRPSGVFQLYADNTDLDMLQEVISNTFYLLSENFSEYSQSLGKDVLSEIVSYLIDENTSGMQFYEPILSCTIALLEEDGRDEAIRYESIEEGENYAALQEMQSVNWDFYPYGLILVPGYGPTSDDISISDQSIERCDMVVEKYRANLAPFIVLSGGHVHPDRTAYSEAIEMKKYLMETYSIPEQAILVDPYARHTTTNLRNTGRMIFWYDIPDEKPILINTDAAQSIYIAYGLDARCISELGYLPYEKVEALTETDTCMLLHPVSLYRDSNDPLDP